jgi:hypothetical protein
VKRTDFGLFDNWVLWATFGDKRREATEDWGKLHNEGRVFLKFKYVGIGPIGEHL